MGPVITTIKRRYHFESAHWLPLVAETHKCHRIHGHNYELEVVISSADLNNGWVMDFWDLDRIVAPLIEKVDHRLLNDIEGLGNPTAELIAHWFMLRIMTPIYPRCQVESVSVFETKDAIATVTRA